MTDRVTDDLVALLPPLLEALEALGFIARHLHPPEFAAVLESVGCPDDPLRAVTASLEAWPEAFCGVRGRLDSAAEATLAAFDGLRAAADVREVYRALRQLPRAQEALYPLAANLAPVNHYFLEPAKRADAGLLASLARPPTATVMVTAARTGVLHGATPQPGDTGQTDGADALAGTEPGGRGGFSVYVPEYYTPDRDWPLVMALHGGSGNGRAFLWSWLREARGHGAIVVAPTALGPTWALMGDDIDTPNLVRILDIVRGRWRIDPARMLLTGMSDGGTFSYVSGLEPASPFTHLAPVAAAFHPMLAQAADARRLRGLPIHVVHGALDWMFPVEMARQAERALRAAGARVTYREIADLSHCYPREINTDLLRWLVGAGEGSGAVEPPGP